ncbi:hypothetical protein [Rubrobacter xylanophilus]|uniref:hypothetical protein n=1 Tax=Rubrobacter xylanophilus TaxID=49319 RepID=UPI00155ADFBE|nr:hypothetical protein [Rubrobacter xylanophilus]
MMRASEDIGLSWGAVALGWLIAACAGAGLSLLLKLLYPVEADGAVPDLAAVPAVSGFAAGSTPVVALLSGATLFGGARGSPHGGAGALHQARVVRSGTPAEGHHLPIEEARLRLGAPDHALAGRTEHRPQRGGCRPLRHPTGEQARSRRSGWVVVGVLAARGVGVEGGRLPFPSRGSAC